MAIPHRFARGLRVGLLAVLCTSVAAHSYASFDLRPIREMKIAESLGQCRAVPVDLGGDRGIFIAYCEDAEIDPYVEMNAASNWIRARTSSVKTGNAIEAMARYAHPFYRANQRRTATGCDVINPGGIEPYKTHCPRTAFRQKIALNG